MSLPSFMDFPSFSSGTMSELPAIPTGQQDTAISRQRDNMLCQRCRHDKQKCSPRDRNWDLREKCKRCLERGYDCSAPEKAPFKPRKRRATAATQNVTSPSASHTQDHYIDTPVPMPDKPERVGTSSRSRPILAWQAEFNSQPAENQTSSNLQSDLESSVTSARKLGEQEARIILAKLGDLNATRELLRADLRLCDQVDVWLGSSLGVTKIRAAIKAAMAAIRAEFSMRLAEAEPFVTRNKDIGPFKEAFISQLRFIKYRFFNPLALSEASSHDDMDNATDDIDDDDVQEKLHELHKRKKIWSAADYLFGNASGRQSSRHPVHAHSEADVVFCYVKASEGIKDVFSDIVLEDADHRQTLSMGFGHTKGSISAFPPCHLAVAQAGASVLLGLKRRSEMPVWDVDYLQRTPVHVAAYAGRVQGLQSIFQDCLVTATYTGRDAFGLTPLAVAACKDDVKTFMRLTKAGAHLVDVTPAVYDGDGVAMSVLALAARNASMKVIKYILDHPLPSTFQRESSELCQALLNDQKHIANILIDQHRSNSIYTLDGQIDAAIRVATAKGYQDIVLRLQDLTPRRQEAAQSLDDMTFDSFINQNAFTEMLTPFESTQSTASYTSDFDVPAWSPQESNMPSFSSFSTQSSSGFTSGSISNPGYMSMPNYTRCQNRRLGRTGIEPP